MLKGTIFILFVLSLITIIFLAKKKFNCLLKALLIILCTFILLFTGLMALIMVDGYRIERGAKLFIQNAIFTFNDGKLPPISCDVKEEEKVQMVTLVDKLPREDYKVEYSDNFGNVWEFYIHFENGESFFCAVDAPGTFMRLFARTNYTLFRFEEKGKILAPRKFHEGMKNYEQAVF